MTTMKDLQKRYDNAVKEIIRCTLPEMMEVYELDDPLHLKALLMYTLAEEEDERIEHHRRSLKRILGNEKEGA